MSSNSFGMEACAYILLTFYMCNKVFNLYKLLLATVIFIDCSGSTLRI